MTHTRQEIEEAIEDVKYSGLKTAKIVVKILQSLLDGKIGPYAEKEEIKEIIYNTGFKASAEDLADALLNKIPKPREVGEEDIYNVLITELPISKYLSIPSHKLREVAKKIAALNKELHDKKGEK